MIDLSIILLTYNQEQYIGKALDSIFIQKFTGVFEVIICDDFSSDSTQSIINGFIGRFDNVKFIKNDVNIGLSKNYQNAILNSKGKYIAYLEGDDYWTDEFKIQKQFDALESNPNYSLAFHNFVYVDKNAKILNDSNTQNETLKRNRTIKDMVNGCLIHQNTIMFRNVFKQLPKWFFLAKNHDTWLLAYLSNWGPALYVECSPLHYRMLENSLWSSLSFFKKHYNGFVTILTILPIVPSKYYLSLFRKLSSKVFQMIRTVYK